MATPLTRIAEQLQKQGLDPGTNPARAWLVSKMRQAVRPTRTELFRDRQSLKGKTYLGRFYFFFYNPKLKEKLPYWDRFPLCIPITRYTDGFLGLNLHYITPKDRMKLLNVLSRYATGTITDEKTRLRLTYPILQATAQAYQATPCIKRYLYTHIKSRFLEIPAPEWDIAAALPLQSFKSQTTVSATEVWMDSKEKY